MTFVVPVTSIWCSPMTRWSTELRAFLKRSKVSFRKVRKPLPSKLPVCWLKNRWTGCYHFHFAAQLSIRSVFNSKCFALKMAVLNGNFSTLYGTSQSWSLRFLTKISSSWFTGSYLIAKVRFRCCSYLLSQGSIGCYYCCIIISFFIAPPSTTISSHLKKKRCSLWLP